ncbi:hypothetical protein C6N75_08300 [Streptomyces solincola]|uniref:DUF4328 domain-containing protein n=1 Tax=Streptomyces solincola TaxID=2100817 RepID=A0A2S9PZ18_9ACTN|nr:DUF4328 domain-containing protein [Streptomyces solincola]PRH79670.1 hypothetical protein C6N75_08300 [Streptomyces solincola]
MLCSHCKINTAVAPDGRCPACAPAPGVEGQPAPAAAHPPAPPAVPAGPVLRSPVGPGRAVVALLCAGIAVDLFAVFAELHLYAFLDTAAMDGTGDWESGAERADLLMVAAGVLQMLALTATAVLFIVWLYRVRRNAAVFAPDVLTSGAGWAVGGWFVPVANLWMPRRIVGQSWRASTRDPYGAPAKGEGHGILHLWWALWLASLLMDRFAGRAYDRAETAQKIMDAAQALALSEAVSVAAAVCAVLVVRRLTALQHAKALRGPQTLPAPPAVPQPME